MRFIESWIPATLVATRDLTPSIRELLIRPESFDGATYPVGSHINVAVTIDGRPETRSYSLVGEADRGGYRIAVRRAEDSRGGSRYMWSLAPGARLSITLPASLLQIDWARRHYCLIAGGIGITPLVGAAQVLACRDADFTLHYAVPCREQAAYLDVLAPLLNERLIVHAADEGRRLNFDNLFASLPPDALTMLCGPMRMLDAARRAWDSAGRTVSDLRYETFGSSGSLPTEGFRVRFVDRNLEIEIPSDRSLLDVLNESGCEVIADCRRGECGVCAIDIIKIDGELDHRDVFFSEPQKRANEKICACVSRARGTITVDIRHRPDAL
ncbi:vanillate O-demethylase ferredoxin subunit [Bradyrhizobium sp. USDA 4532]|uniref:PDR/VanB family oxidoreductase n=1 Tax=unclassified Bradyrhizobium TaxID=2631580 RepID=UPI00209DCA66|nr:MULTISPECIES: PDR/VanB family oxidoreductase [unclassified Bradyrhizobium]MCP1835867.1 vanillate O-demethylase ferredoxin subunit [Bradyrhizobium sp. USDA 4545]MCP1920615.1 vanillate O-demethylase ferredoxin subunit [Bradyrhizobium sp. USDA 4532]